MSNEDKVGISVSSATEINIEFAENVIHAAGKAVMGLSSLVRQPAFKESGIG